MAVRIISRLVRGRPFFEVSPVLFPAFAAAASTLSATEAYRLDLMGGGL